MTSNSAPIFSIDQVIKAVGGVLIAGAAENTVYGVSTDSRQVEKGNIFIALQGENFDGHGFVHKAVEKGVASVIISNEALLDLKKVDKAVSVIKASDTLQALGDLAHNYRQRFSLPVIGLNRVFGQDDHKGNDGNYYWTKKNYSENGRKFKQFDRDCRRQYFA